MRYVFSFSFYDLVADAVDDENEDDQGVEFGFLLDEGAMRRLGLVSADMGLLPVAHNEWLGEVADELEESYGAVHDFSGTGDDNILVEGYTTYEIPTIEKARELMAQWRAAFVAHIGEEGVGPIVEATSEQTEQLIPGYSGNPEEVVALFEKLQTLAVSSPRTGPGLG